MKVAVRYMAQLRSAAACASEEIELASPCTLSVLLRQLAERHGEPFRRMLLDAAGNLQPSLLVFRGEDQIEGETPLALKDGDVLTLLTPMAGG